MAAPLVWVATELGRTHLFSGFPWVLLGYSQVTVLPIAQLASVFGVYGVSALVAERQRRGGGVRGATPPCAIAAGRGRSRCLVVVAAWGSWRASRAEVDARGRADPGRPRAGQRRSGGEVGRRARGAIFQDYLRMTRQAIGAGAELVIWPESSTPFMFEEDLRRRRPGPHARAAGARPDSARQRPDRLARRPTAACRPLLQLGVPRAGRRNDRRRVSQDAPGAVRRVRAAQAGCCFSRRRSSKPSAAGFAPATRRRCCRSAGTRSARRSATRSSIRIWCGSSSAAAASC